MSVVPLQNSALSAASLASGIVTPEALEYAQRVARHRLSNQGLDANAPIPDTLLSEILIEQNILTTYQATQLSAGRTKLKLGPYIITDWIGQGGMGQVFKGIHQIMGRESAVKVLMGPRSTQVARDSFIREIRMQAKLDCPYLVRAFDAGQDGGVHYLVTEYVPGMDLRRLIKSRGPLPVQQAARIIMQAALGLSYAHNAGLVHRDVKPGNILVTPDGEAKVSDVGLAGFAHDLFDDPRAGKIVGTPDFISPEQIKTPLSVGPRADIYSLGCTLYYSVCGKVPFPGGDTHSKLRRHVEETPWHPRKFVPDISEDFVDIIADMMEKDPDKRIASAAEVAARLETWAGDTTGMSTARLGRSPWTAPPPPLDPDDSIPEEYNDDARSGESSLAGSGMMSSATATSGVESGRAILPTRDVGVGSYANNSSTLRATRSTPTHTMSTGMVVALTLAIAVPPALVVGAILGYILGR